FGAALVQKGDLSGAKEAFVQALELDASAAPKSELFGKDVVDAFTAAKILLGDRPRGTLTVDSDPGGARVVVAGEDLGLTPAPARELPIGRHHVIISRPGYVPFGALPDVTSTRAAELRPALEPNPGFAAVQQAAAKLWATPSFHAGELTAEATRLGGQLHARQLVFIAVTTDREGKAHASVEAVDLVRGDRLKAVSFEVDEGWRNTFAAVERVETWLARPAVLAPVSKPFVLPPVLKNPWLWAAVGGAAAVVTTGVLIANRPPGGLDLVLGTR
ncbi:MAG: PEGA domain-containing protein, partial [Myxococcaceae bacterium]